MHKNITNKKVLAAFFDVDGVLKEYSPQGLPSRFEEDAIKGLSMLYENGIIIGYASGKCNDYLIDCALLSKTLYPNSIIIGENGGVISLNGSRFIYDKFMEDIYKARRFLENFADEDGVYKIPDNRKKKIYEIREEDKESMITLLFCCKNEEERMNLRDTIHQIFIDYPGLTLSFGDSYVDVNQRGCDKGYAIRKVSEILGFSLDNISAVGDGNNDIPMLEIVGFPACPSNSKEYVKEVVRRRGYVANYPVGKGTYEICTNYLLRKSKI